MITNTPDEATARVMAFISVIRHAPDDADCALCLDQLDGYVQAQLAAADYRAQFAWTAQHLDGCVSCAEAYALHYEAALAEAHGRLPQPDHLPQPDLAFLHAAVDWLAVLQAALRITPARFTLQLNETLNRLLPPTPTPALTRSAADGRYQPKLLELNQDQAHVAGLPFTLAVYADRQQPDRCLVEITVQPPGQSWPDLGGYLVTLTAAEQSVTTKTDDWGTAVFPDVPLAQLEQVRLDVAIGR
ncbi:MAG: hypothetical protein IPM39_29295 [Chloroflexi bacterium]|nr:hypothetical protein [Chloroflexota bacterium]